MCFSLKNFVFLQIISQSDDIMIDHDTTERIKAAAKIEEVIGEFVTLHRRGANYIGCCPFHNEKTPSFTVSPAKGFFKCFGCGESGNAIGFLMKHEHYTYPEALRWLAKKYNIEIVEKELTEEQKQRNSERDVLYHVSEFAQKYFADLLYNNEMGRAVGLSYFHKRGLSDEIIKEFGLGYCLDEWRGFTDYARKNGYSDEALEKSGLTIFKEDRSKCYDRFRDRVTFPIFSISGRVLGFSCRILSSDKSAAKYVNSPDSEIYNKSHTLYGIFQAKSTIVRQDKCYLVEGNVDVVSMHQSGVKNTVASCGTSLTTDQIRLIKRFTQNVTILYDGDAAGIKATKRAVDMLYAEGMKVRMVLFPDGDDPDSYAQKYGSTKLQEYLQQNEENFILYKLRVIHEDIQKDPIRKADFLKELVDTIALVPDLLERNEYIAQCASLLETSERSLSSQLAVAMHRNMMNAAKAQQTTSQPTSTEEVPPVEPTPEEEASMQSTSSKVESIPIAERKIIQLLVNYGTNNISVEVAGEEAEDPAQSKATYIECPVAKVIIADLLENEVSFESSQCQQVFDLYVNSIVEKDEVPELTSLINSDDEKIQSLVLAFTVTFPELSPTWGTKNIYVKTIEDNLSQDVFQSLLNLKLHIIDSRIADNAKRWKEAKSDDEVMQLLAEKQQLISIRTQICNTRNFERPVI